MVTEKYRGLQRSTEGYRAVQRSTKGYREVQRVTEKYSYYEATYKIYRRDLYGKTSKRRVNYKANTMYI